MQLLRLFRQLVEDTDIEIVNAIGVNGAHDAEAIPASKNFKHFKTPLADRFLGWRLFGFPHTTSKIAANVAFAPNSHVLPFMSSVPFVTTIHDVSPVKTPWQVARKGTILNSMFMRSAARFSSRILTVSECSKRDIIETYGVDPNRIVVTYLGIDTDVYNPVRPAAADLDAAQKTFEIQRPYIFHHGAVQPRKNLDGLIRAYKQLMESNPGLELDLVLAGARGWGYESTVELAKQSSGDRGRVILTGAVADNTLALLLKGAELCVFPSFYEGFCLPMVEAMACGIPSIASNTSCLPEVSGGVLRYFSPNSGDEMTEIIKQSIYDSDERVRLRQGGLHRAMEFRWEKTAEQTLAVLKEAGSQVDGYK
jgi:glycosyltransferase involved in cell wall biosynthesis